MCKFVKIGFSTLLLFTALFLLPFCENSAEAASPVSGTWGNLNWTLDSNGLLTISGSGAMEDLQITNADAWSAYKDHITKVVIKSGVSSIGKKAFYYCTGLWSVTIPDSVTSIDNEAFERCHSLTSVTIPSSVTSIGESAFWYCGSLTSVTIPSSVTSIGEGAFASCNSLTSVTIASGVREISSYAFASCHSLTSVTIPDSVTSIGNYAFNDCRNLMNIDVDDRNTEYCSIGGVLFNKTEDTLIRYPAGRDGTYYEIPFSVTSIDEGAFIGCHSLASITIPSSVMSIGVAAFWGCDSLASVTIPDRVTEICGRVFYQCDSLTSVTIPDSVTSIGDYAFWDCDSLTSVTIPDSVTSIGRSAFEGCTSLVDVYYTGSEGQWASITVGVLNESLTGATIHFAGGMNSYTITFNANGGTVSPTSKTVTNGSTYGTLPTPTRSEYRFDGWFTSVSGGTQVTGSTTVNLTANQTLYAHWTYTPSSFMVTFNANGGTVSPTSKTVTNGSTYGTLPTPTRNEYSFDGWFTLASGGIQVTSSTTVNLSTSQTLYAHWTKSYTITYNANGGTGTPSSQIKEENVSLTLSSLKPSKYYTIQYNAAGGTVSPASKNMYCTFNNWNIAQNGSGISYAPGSQYTANADATLYAQWINPPAGTLATPTRNGYDFVGWFTSASGGNQINETSVITGNMTVYAHWMDPYNMGDETYSFENYGDSDSPGGHCFGMSMTSAGYHLGLLDISRIGGNSNTSLYNLNFSQIVKQPICYYAGIQGSWSANAIVAGGSTYLYGYSSINSDWQEVVSYVNNHDYDHTGLLQIGFRKNGEGGHAINFLRYERINGQDRIYAYDNNFPNQETYFYRDSSGYVRQAPVQTFSGAIDCIALRDCRIYFNSVGSFDGTHVLYMLKDAATVQGYSYSYMETDFSDEEYVMYEIPSSQDRVTIIPNRDHADFIYMDTEFSFGEITDETRGELKFATLDEHGASTGADFRIFESTPEYGEPDFTLPAALTEIGESAFEGIAATTVYIPDTCTNIGAYAFRNATITQIRIPAKCSIADTAFTGCTKVVVFGTPGSTAELFCYNHENCKFVAETQ